jgi:two-component system NarL family sensor kinase
MKLLVVIILLTAPAVVIAQNNNPIDSLIKLLPKSKTDTGRINLLNEIGDHISNTRATEGLKYADEAIQLSDKINFKKGLADGYFNRGQMFFNILKSDSAKSDFEKAIRIYKQINNPAGLAHVYNEMGRLVRVTGDRSAAIVYFQQAADMFEKINDLDGSADCLSYIANSYNQLYDFDKALTIYKKAYDIRMKIKNYGKAAQTLAGIGITYRNKQTLAKDTSDSKNFKLSLQYLFKARKLFITYKHPLNIALIAREIGFAYQLQLQDKNALIYLLEAVRRFTEIDNKRELSPLYKDIGKCYLNLKQYPQAKVYFDKGLEAALAENYLQHIADSYTELYHYYKALHNDKMSLLYHEKWMTANDSLNYHINIDKLTELNTKYETEKKEQQINLLAKENTIQKLSIIKQKTTIGIIGSVFLAALVFGGLLYNRNKHKQKIALQQQMLSQQEHLTKAIIDAEEKERQRIASDLHDGVGQLFSAVKMNLNGLLDRVTINREEDRFLAEKTLALVDESCKEVRVISHQMMPNMLLRSGIASDVKSFIEKIDSESLKVSVEATGFKNKLESNVEIVLYRVIQETVNNVIKHAKATTLFIKLHRDATGINAIISDNGIGFNVALKDDFEGIGLKNITTRIEYLKGSVNYQSEPGMGTTVNIWVPIA